MKKQWRFRSFFNWIVVLWFCHLVEYYEYKTKNSVVVIVVVDVRERSALKEKVRAKSSKLLDTKFTQTMANKKLIYIVGSTWSSYTLNKKCGHKLLCFIHLFLTIALKSSMTLVGWSSNPCCCAHNFGFVAFLCCCSHNFAVVAFLLVILVAKRRAALYIVIASGVTMVDRALPVFKRLCFQRKILLPHLHSLAFSWLAITLGTCQLNTKYNTLQSAGRYWTGFKAEKYYERLSRSCVSPAGEYFCALHK